MSEPDELLRAVNEIHDLVRVMAEPAIAERDAKLRNELKRIVGSSKAAAKAVRLMDGARTQVMIQRESQINQGQPSSLVKKLNSSKLLSNELKHPKLSIPIPTNFFDGNGDE